MMTEDFILPDIGEGIVECEVVEWMVKEGDLVEEDQAVADVQTDKALVQIPAKHSGRITKLYVEQGEIAKVHAPLFQIELPSDSQQSEPSRAAPHAQQEPVPTKVEHIQQSIQASDDSKRKVLATPAVRRIARENKMDIDQVNGTGPKGRVLKADMINALSNGSSSVTQPVPVVSTVDVKQDVTIIPMKGIRAVMAKQMLKSVSTIPHFTYAEEIDITKVNNLRRELNESMSENETRLTLMSFFVKSLSLALFEHPILNSHMSDDGSEIHQYAEHNVGMAVDSPSGLLVPNIKLANRLSLTEIAKEVKTLAEAGRSGRLAPDTMKGGTITISNIGAIGGTVTTPIVNAPEVAIVGIGRIQKLPRVDEQGNIVVREVIQVSWSGDHRVIDGGTIARFTNSWKELLEQPQKMLLSLR